MRYLNLCVVYMCDIEIYVPHTCATWILTHVTHKIYLNKYKTLEYYERPKSMCGIYVWHRDVCATYMYNMDSMSHTHIYLIRYKTLILLET